MVDGKWTRLSGDASSYSSSVTGWSSYGNSNWMSSWLSLYWGPEQRFTDFSSAVRFCLCLLCQQSFHGWRRQLWFHWLLWFLWISGSHEDLTPSAAATVQAWLNLSMILPSLYILHSPIPPYMSSLSQFSSLLLTQISGQNALMHQNTVALFKDIWTGCTQLNISMTSVFMDWPIISITPLCQEYHNCLDSKPWSLEHSNS